MKTSVVKTVRCAIYTRVSTDHGLDQEFNSLDAQYEAASAYYKESGARRLDPYPIALRRRRVFRRVHRPTRPAEIAR
jgi:DNA invertase Pin-like site-specific DNA recombinase